MSNGTTLEGLALSTVSQKDGDWKSPGILAQMLFMQLLFVDNGRGILLAFTSHAMTGMVKLLTFL